MRAIILNASAGSGKTYTLAYNYVRDVIREPMLYRHILAVTFTNKATEEMKSRILKEIHLLSECKESNYLEDLCRELALDEDEVRSRAKRVQGLILHDYSHFTILTIDKFFQRVLHAFLKELGIELNFNVELESAPTLTRSVDSLIERIASDSKLKEWLSHYSEERMNESEGWDLRGDIIKLGGELFKESYHSSLKNRASRDEIDRLHEEFSEQYDTSRTEFQEIAVEAVKLISDNHLSLNDFSYKNSGAAAYFYTIASGKIDEPKARVRECALSGEKLMTKDNAKRYATLLGELQELMARLCDYYDTHIEEWNTTLLFKEHYRTFALLSDIYDEAQRIWRNENTLLLSETKNILSKFIEGNDAPFIYEKVGNRYDRYLIDEFQDTSEREWLNFLPLLHDAMSHLSQLSTDSSEESPAVLLVGDVKQSIYRWRGGDWRILGQKAKSALGEAVSRDLRFNFRSLKNIVEFNNSSMAGVIRSVNLQLRDKMRKCKLSRELKRELIGTLPRAYRNFRQIARKECKIDGYISIERFDKQPPIIERICEVLDRGYNPSDIMILVRSARDGGKAASALLEFKRKNREPKYNFEVMTQDSLTLNSAPICSFLIALFNLISDPNNSIQRGIFNKYLNRSVESELEEEELQQLRQLRMLPPEEAFERIVQYYHLNESASEVAYLQAFHEQLLSYTSSRIADIPLFVKWWEEHGYKRSLTAEESSNTIEITTIHKAKGLEKRVVIIPYCSWSLEPKSTGELPNFVWTEAEGSLKGAGCIPVRFSSKMIKSQFDASYFRELTYSYVDNVNLLYVALTRAKCELHVFIPNSHANIGEHLLYAIKSSGADAQVGKLCGSTTVTDSGFTRYEFGVAADAISEKEDREREVKHATIRRYPSTDFNPKLSLPNSKYLEKGGDKALSPRNFGVLMHRIFEEAESEREVYIALQKIRDDGLLSPAEHHRLEQRIKEALSTKVVSEWYRSEWDMVLQERNIILEKSETYDPKRGKSRRPDRVMIRGKRAVIADYKFGERESKGNIDQLKDYAHLLREMGYEEVEAWLWYVKLGITERVV